MDERKMMEPPARAVIMWRAQAWETRKEPVRLTSRRLRNMAASYVSALMLELCAPVSVAQSLESGIDSSPLRGLLNGPYSTTPAELITMSTEPRSEVIWATASATALASRTSTL